jgi:hypothetical protein
MQRLRVLIALFLGFAVVTTAFAAGQWALLGTRAITERDDHETISLMSARGDFHRIKLGVAGSTVAFHRIVVTFAHGSRQVVDLKDEVRAGSRTHGIDLTGDDRVIRQVDFWYTMKSNGTNGALVHLYGR